MMVDDECCRTAPTSTTPTKSSSASAPTPTRNATASSAKALSDVLDHAASEMASGSKLGIDATKKLARKGFKRPWPPLIKMDAAVEAKAEKLFNP